MQITYKINAVTFQHVLH